MKDFDLTGAGLSNAVLTNAFMSGTKLVNANLTGVKWLDTQCPDGSHSSDNNPGCGF